MLKKTSETYEAKTGCLNCNNIETFYIKKGVLTVEFLDKMTPSCRNCGCKQMIRMYDEYKATKDLIKEFIMHSHGMEMGEEEEEKIHDHYG